MKQILRWLVGAAGFACLAAGAWGILADRASGGGLALVVVGALFALVPLLLDRLERISLSNTGLEFGLSRQIAEQGAPKAAQILDHTELARLAEAYAVVHDELPDPTYTDARTHIQDVLVARAAALARRQKFDPVEVNTLFRNSAPVTRVLALGLMKGDPALIDVATLSAAIGRPATRNEQYHALVLVKQCWNRFTTPEQAMIHASIDHADMSRSSRRYELAVKIRNLPVATRHTTMTAPDSGARP
jgi:hypothetical protein